MLDILINTLMLHLNIERLHLSKPEVGIYKRKQENKNSTKKAIKKTRKQELDQKSDQEKKTFFFS